jgi:succinoglycan biosynthesis protein ExoM
MTKIGLSVCTYRRNDLLRRLLQSVSAASDYCADRAQIGVVVVDDNPDGLARPVVEEFEEVFPLGIRYVPWGQRNISKARNRGLEEATRIGDWVAMADDDVVVPPHWFRTLLDVQVQTDADAVTGPMDVCFPPGSPHWLSDEPFADIGAAPALEDGPVRTCATSNTLMRTAWLMDHPDIRFDEDLGRLGGEDMVFFRTATANGLRAFFSREVAVRQIEPVERSTFSYQLRRALWMGNSEFVTNDRLGAANRWRLFGRGGRRALRALGRVVSRGRRGEPPQLRYTLAAVAEGVGIMLGACGVTLEHR